MRKYLLQSSQVNADEIKLNELEPEYRKATLNMIMAITALKKVLNCQPQISRQDVACLIATHFGEVESTLDFLSTFRQSKIARPILFQNSLHNSTLGFASIQLGLKGPGMTISADENTVHAAANCAESLLQTNDYVLVCFIDYIPKILAENYLKKHPFIKPHLNFARAYLLTKNLPQKPAKEILGRIQDFPFLENV